VVVVIQWCCAVLWWWCVVAMVPLLASGGRRNSIGVGFPFQTGVAARFVVRFRLALICVSVAVCVLVRRFDGVVLVVVVVVGAAMM
jgi:hypothetical protein